MVDRDLGGGLSLGVGTRVGASLSSLDYYGAAARLANDPSGAAGLSNGIAMPGTTMRLAAGVTLARDGRISVGLRCGGAFGDGCAAHAGGIDMSIRFRGPRGAPAARGRSPGVVTGAAAVSGAPLTRQRFRASGRSDLAAGREGLGPERLHRSTRKQAAPVVEMLEDGCVGHETALGRTGRSNSALSLQPGRGGAPAGEGRAGAARRSKRRLPPPSHSPASFGGTGLNSRRPLPGRLRKRILGDA